MSEYVMHMLVGGGPPWCGAADPGPVPWGQVTKITVCLDCMSVTTELPREATMRYKLEEVRRDLARKLRGMSEADRANYKETLVSVAAASLADPDCAPPMFDEKQVLAALYAIGSIRAGYVQIQRSGVRPTYAMLKQAAHEMEMIIVGLAEGLPQ